MTSCNSNKNKGNITNKLNAITDTANVNYVDGSKAFDTWQTHHIHICSNCEGSDGTVVHHTTIHPTTNDNFNNSLIPVIFGKNIAE